MKEACVSWCAILLIKMDGQGRLGVSVRSASDS